MDRLTVEGELPHELRGAFIQSGPHPAQAFPDPGEAAYFSALTGVRLAGGEARWYRTPAGAPSPLGAVPALAAATRAGARVARPAHDPETGEWHTVATTPGSVVAEHLVMSRANDVACRRMFPLSGPSLVTSVALTRRHLVVVDPSLEHDRAAALVGLRAPYSWRAGKEARIGLLPKGRPGPPRWFAVPPCAVSHLVNAYDEGDQVVVDAVRHDRPLDSGTHPDLVRWILDTATGEVTEQLLAVRVDTATAEPGAAGRRHRHVYGTSESSVFRYDLLTDSTCSHDLGPGWRVGQPAHVGDDGRLLVLASNAALRESALVLFDAAEVSAGPRARVRLPVHVPATGRSAWQADALRPVG